MSSSHCSLERFIIIRVVFASIVIISLASIILFINPPGVWGTVCAFLLVLCVCSYFSIQTYLVITKMVSRFDEHAKMLSIGNYGDIPGTIFNAGVARKLDQTLSSLTSKFDQRKLKYDERVLMIYQLIDHLNTPIAVFNSRNHLVYFNESFSSIHQVNLNTKVKVHADSIGLKKEFGKWHYERPGWEIRSSSFVAEDAESDLLVFVNIDTALREKEMNSWSNIIRILTHEINNSLTPISMLSEGLKNAKSEEKKNEALAAISDRCHHLKDFVARYSSVAKPYTPKLALFSPYELSARISIMYSQVDIKIMPNIKDAMYADLPFIEQVCINMVKNSIEAGASNITMRIEELEKQYTIVIIDDGDGISNLENLFVPLYTTKENGQGIGLSFCRKIIDAHNGTITVENGEVKGVKFEIFIPKKERD